MSVEALTPPTRPSLAHIEAQLIANWPATLDADPELQSLVEQESSLPFMAGRWYRDIAHNFLQQAEIKLEIRAIEQMPMSDEKDQARSDAYKRLRPIEAQLPHYIYYEGLDITRRFDGNQTLTQRFVGRIMRHVVDDVNRETHVLLAVGRDALTKVPPSIS